MGLPDRDYPVLYILSGVSSVVAFLLVPVGMVGFHVLQRHSYGREAREALFGLVVGLVSMVVGFALYGVATLQAKVLPRWCGVAFIAALPVALALSVSLHFSSIQFIVFGLAWLALGYALWARREALAVQQPRRVR